MNIDKTLHALRATGYVASFFQNSEAAAAYLTRSIHHQTVGFGDSATLASLALYQRLSVHNQVYDPQHLVNGASFQETGQKALTASIFLTSVNALAETGELVNLDGTGNRIAGSLFGHERVYFIAGTNKLVPTLQDAVWRARNVAAPRNARRLGLNTPCARGNARCFDCHSPERICNGLLLYLQKMDGMEMELLLIDEVLGL